MPASATTTTGPLYAACEAAYRARLLEHAVAAEIVGVLKMPVGRRTCCSSRVVRAKLSGAVLGSPSGASTGKGLARLPVDRVLARAGFDVAGLNVDHTFVGNHGETSTNAPPATPSPLMSSWRKVVPLVCKLLKLVFVLRDADQCVGVVEIRADLRGLVAEVFAVELVAVDVEDPGAGLSATRPNLVGDVDLVVIGRERVGDRPTPAACPNRPGWSETRSFHSSCKRVTVMSVSNGEPRAGASQARLTQVAEIAVRSGARAVGRCDELDALA